MITLAPGDDASAPSPHGPPLFDVTVTHGGRAATLAVSGSGGDDELLRGALDALLTSGVVHGLDRAHVAEVVAARDGAAHPVARATLPTAPVDGELELIFDEEARHDPLHTVAAGTLLARCTPPRAGSDGVAVTGEPLCAPDALAPSVSAGEGAEQSLVGSGITVVRALIDGRPRFDDGVVAVEPALRTPRLLPRTGTTQVFGTLEVGGDVSKGAHIAVTGDLRVAGDVERAHIDTGGDITIGGSCLGSEVRAGALGSVHRGLLAALGEADGALVSASSMAEQVVRSVRAAGRRMGECEALRMVLERRFPDLASGVAEAARTLREPGVEVEERVADAIAAAAAVMEAVTTGAHVDSDRVMAAGRALAKAMLMMRSTAGLTSGIEAVYMQASRVEARGSLVLTGAGTYNVDAHVGGDLRALAPGATVRGGTLHVGGVLLTSELGAPGGACVRVVLEGLGGPTRLAAGIAHPGVEVLCGGRSIAVEARTLNLAVGFDEENRVVCSEDLLD